MKAIEISAFAATQQKLLDAELKAELSETTSLVTQFAPAALQRAGLAILNLQVAAQRTGLGGKPVVDVELDPAVSRSGGGGGGGGRGGEKDGELPEHGIRTGDIVGLQQQPSGSAKKKERDEMEQSGAKGVVLRVTAKKVSVAMDKDDADLPGGKLWL